MKKIKVASLFSGCGGGDLGLLGGFSFLGQYYERLRTTVVLANDVDPFATQTYRANFKHPFISRSVTDLSSAEIPDHDLLVGGFPCQTFSIVGQRKGLSDLRGQLFLEMARILRDRQPSAFVAENVKGLTNLQQGKVFEVILREFEAAGYRVTYKVLNASNYGIPQKRERVFIVGFRNDIRANFRFPSPLNKLVALESVLQDDYDQRFIFSQRAVAGMKRANKAFNKGRAQNVKEPCNTVNSHLAKISLNGTDPVLLVDEHLEIYRRFTPLEAARIQSFPDTFIFPVSEFQTYKQIGNAIPPVLMWHVTSELLRALDASTSVVNQRAPVVYDPSFLDFPLFAQME